MIPAKGILLPGPDMYWVVMEIAQTIGKKNTKD